MTKFYRVSNDDTIESSRKLAQTEGLLSWYFCWANAHAAALVAARPEKQLLQM